MQTIVDTSTIQPSDRVAAWEAAASKSFAPYRASVTSGVEDFAGVIAVGQLDTWACVSLELSECVIDWTIDDSSAWNDTMWILATVSGNFRLVRGGRTQDMNTGQICLTGTLPLYRTEIAGPTRVLVIAMRRALLEDRIGQLTSLDALVAPAELPGVRALSAYLQALCDQVEAGVGRSEVDVIRVAIDLLVFALNDFIPIAPPGEISSRTAAMLRLEQALTHHLRNPDVTAESIASEAELSVRYANQLLAGRGTSLMRELAARRLDRVAGDLANPAHRNRSVADIATGWGFRNMSRLGGRFQKRFGVSPNHYRLNAASFEDADSERPMAIDD